MHVGPSFEDVLDRMLGMPAEPAHASAGARVATAAGYGFFCFDRTPAKSPPAPVPADASRLVRSTLAGRGQRRPAAGSDTGWRAGNDGYAAADTGEPVQGRVGRSPEQLAALADLRALGAHLGSDFTLIELRRAFRALARRYHPDRHPRAAAATKAELAMHFRRARSAYVVLSRTEPPRQRPTSAQRRS